MPPIPTVAYRTYAAFTYYILWLSSTHSAKCAVLIHHATVVLGSGFACIVSSKINDTIAKLLAFQSGNLCAFPGCVQKLAILQNNLWGGSILGEMAHICG